MKPDGLLTNTLDLVIAENQHRILQVELCSLILKKKSLSEKIKTTKDRSDLLSEYKQTKINLELLTRETIKKYEASLTED